MKRVIASVVAVVLVAGALPALRADEKKVDPVDLVRKHIDSLPNGKGVGEVTPQSAAIVKKVFPDYQMVIVRFRIYPVARIMPEGLRPSNIFVVDKNGKLEHLKDVKTLEKFFRGHAFSVKDDKDAKTILAAWLTLTPEFHQDGMFKFDVLDKEFTADASKASGRAIVMQGGNGELKAVLQIDKDGRLAKVEEKAAIRAGPRPICQATKLLDADPIVRRMAEQDLLIMGVSARGYLMEQRGRATPELRDAIDRLWRQIEKNGW
ncbi:MAG: hypothetical protein HYR84_04300 [Planctomycetes bacterium]|nr:hypothetical protein [Planctomycetota bacterium]